MVSRRRIILVTRKVRRHSNYFQNSPDATERTDQGEMPGTEVTGPEHVVTATHYL